MSSYDLETRRLLCSERVERLAQDARRSPGTGRRRRRILRAALGKLALRPADFRARRASLS